jgi:hypothetical protein
MKHPWTALSIAIFLFATIPSPAQNTRAKEFQGPVLRPSDRSTNLTERGLTPRGYSYGTGGSEVLATNFMVAGNSCLSFSSSLDLMGADTAAIGIVAANVDIRQTRVIPFFGIEGAPLMFASGKILQGDSFYAYIDAGSGIVPVLGSFMFVRVCNDETYVIRYSQLTLYVSHR